MTAFTSITFEVKISGAWVDISADVLAEPAPHCTRGISGNEPEDRVADPGRLTFSLNNSITNSAGLLGYYSPGHASCLSGWGPSLLVRLSFTYAGVTKVKWRGYIDRDGIKVIPGTLGPRRVDVTCTDWMGLAASHKINLLQLAANQTLTQATTTLLNNMPLRPVVVNLSDTITMPSVFDQAGSETTALGELTKFATSARTEFYLRAGAFGEELTNIGGSTMPDPTSTDAILLEDGTNLLLEDGTNVLMDVTTSITVADANMLEGTDISYGSKLYNYLTVITNPRHTDAAATTVLWTLEQATDIVAGDSITIRGQYNNPGVSARAVKGTEMVSPVSGTDWKANAASNGTGADKTANVTVTATFGAAEVEFIITNNDAATIYIGGGTAGAFLQVRGKGVYFDDPVHEIFSDTTSMSVYGVRPYVIDMKYQTKSVMAGAVAGHPFAPSTWITNHKNPYYIPEQIRMCANKSVNDILLFMWCEPGSVVAVTETMSALSAASYIIQSYDFEITDNEKVFWSVVCKDRYAQ
jgi:hypothetical protein